jgi:hypothetical protein
MRPIIFATPMLLFLGMNQMTNILFLYCHFMCFMFLWLRLSEPPLRCAWPLTVWTLSRACRKSQTLRVAKQTWMIEPCNWWGYKC